MRRLLWPPGLLVMLVLAFEGPAWAHSPGGTNATDRAVAVPSGLTFATYRPRGWEAGAVSFGTGDTSPKGSQRVRETQRILRSLGYDPGPVDGIFGRRTEGAVRRFQLLTGLPRDGIVGANTLKALRDRSPEEIVRASTEEPRGAQERRRPSDNRRASARDERSAGSARGGSRRASGPDGARVGRTDGPTGSRRADDARTSASQPGSTNPVRREPQQSVEPDGPGEVRGPRSAAGSDDNPRPISLGIAVVLVLALLGGLLALVARRPKPRGRLEEESCSRGSRWPALPPDAIGTPVTATENLFVEGTSQDTGVGRFAGFVIAFFSTADEQGERHGLYLVDDPARGRGVWVRASDVASQWTAGRATALQHGRATEEGTVTDPQVGPSTQERGELAPARRRVIRRGPPPLRRGNDRGGTHGR
jgi:peptidoglycan hydrolase-like protein with peptidoglycan-binding domain